MKAKLIALLVVSTLLVSPFQAIAVAAQLSYSSSVPSGAGVDQQVYTYSFSVINNNAVTYELTKVEANFSQFADGTCQYDFVPGSIASSHPVTGVFADNPGTLPLINYFNRVVLAPQDKFTLSYQLTLRANPDSPDSRCTVSTLFQEHVETDPIGKVYDHVISGSHTFTYVEPEPTPTPTPNPGGTTGGTTGTTTTTTESESGIVLPPEWLTEGNITTRLDGMSAEELANVVNPTFDYPNKNRIVFIGTFDLSSETSIAQMNKLGDAIDLSTVGKIVIDKELIPALGEEAAISMFKLEIEGIPELFIDDESYSLKGVLNLKYTEDGEFGRLSFDVQELGKVYEVRMNSGEVYIDTFSGDRADDVSFLEENWATLTAVLLLAGASLLGIFVWKKKQKSEEKLQKPKMQTKKTSYKRVN